MVPFATEPTGWASTNARNGPSSLIGSEAAVLPPRRRRPFFADEGGVVATGAESAGAAAAARPLDFFARDARLRPDRGAPVDASDKDASFAVVGLGGAALAPRTARVARRLVGPRTGARITNTQPTLRTGLPPIRRPSSNSQS